MKKWTLGVMALSVALVSCAQKDNLATNPDNNTLLWKITGNGLTKPSYLFGTIHLLCADDAVLSDNMKKAIKGADNVYLEVDMNNMMEIFGAIGKMKMQGDTTLQDLLSKDDYQKVKTYFEENASMIPFSMLQTFKPILAASVVEGGSLECENTAMMEQVIMDEAKQSDIEVKGLETMSYQAGILDSIPYKLQAEELLNYIKNSSKEDKQMSELWKAYNEQDLKKLEALMIQSDIGMNSYTDILLFNRNRNWVKKLKDLFPGKSLVIAVGAGHLPGEKGVINLLKKEGYTLTPVENKLSKGKSI
ncbi:MAG: TraB/GumN family protein [Chitinophagaceae bacterium]